MMTRDCQTSFGSGSTIASQTVQQTTASIAQAAGRLSAPIPPTPPSLWASDFFWITLAVSMLIGVILEKRNKQ